MSQTTGKVLKVDQVKIDGSIRLSPGMAAAAAPRPQTAAVQPVHSGAAAPKAVIADSHNDHVIIEITCSCGRKMYLRCDYAK